MKVKQEIIEATYSIEDLTKQEYGLLKEGLRSFLSDDYRRSLEQSLEAKEASRLLDLMD
jgi:hypothetical protein